MLAPSRLRAIARRPGAALARARAVARAVSASPGLLDAPASGAPAAVAVPRPPGAHRCGCTLRRYPQLRRAAAARSASPQPALSGCGAASSPVGVAICAHSCIRGCAAHVSVLRPHAANVIGYHLPPECSSGVDPRQGSPVLSWLPPSDAAASTNSYPMANRIRCMTCAADLHTAERDKPNSAAISFCGMPSRK